ncbi:MAG: PEP/pyruvate-binding domain-containing protein [Planctomycetota bacterium]|jgi:hypothetical protein
MNHLDSPDRPESDSSIHQILQSLQERAKELNCLYRIDEILNRTDADPEEAYRAVIASIPPGWQFPEVCCGRLTIDGTTFEPEGFDPTRWNLCADIEVEGNRVGEVAVYYTSERPREDEGPFLKEERRLINAIAERLGLFILQRRLRGAHENLRHAMEDLRTRQRRPWDILLEFLARTDPQLLNRITRKMINHLCLNGIEEAEPLLQLCLTHSWLQTNQATGDNRPLERQVFDGTELTRSTFNTAAEHLNETSIVECIRAWINEEKSTGLIKSLENPGSSLAEVALAVDRYQAAGIDEAELPSAVRTSLKVALLRKYFVDTLTFISKAKDHVDVQDFFELTQRVVHPTRSQGKLGGKSAGLFLASCVLRKATEHSELFSNLRTPRTWYVAADGLPEFVHYNNLEEFYNTKYMEIERVRQDYPHIVHVFKNSRFPPEVVKGLSAALDDFDERPIIIRSSSLLEDQVGAAFSGKYKSLFLANQGSKEQRLEALQDAIAEVYASVFGPDPIEYRAERGLLDFREDMGILIQEVVGTRVGDYFMPACSGVAFSNNEFRWSPRLQREDGLIRMVPGLGTRAVDRMSDDYPVLVAPGQPGIRANVTADEVVRYSPRRMDVINLRTNAFETVDVVPLLRQCGDRFPAVRRLVSMVDQDRVRPPLPLEPDWEHDDFVITFDGLLSDDRVIRQVDTMLKVLRESQCRAQSYSPEDAPSPIPQDVAKDHVIFTASRHVSNGRVPDITHIVYVDPDRYGELPELRQLQDVGRAVGRLNRVLPKRRFILMGGGRWGSRGDIRLGVSVTYSDISNTAMLVEIARRKGSYVPEVSFGTHFFQDLVEAGIRYLPLFPDEPGNEFNEHFFTRSANILPDLLPNFASLAGTVRVIDVARETDGQVLRVLMNGELDQAIGLIGRESTAEEPITTQASEVAGATGQHWRWRTRMAERLAARLAPARFGVKAIYLFGSTKHATAGPASDINLIVHDGGDLRKRQMLMTWLEGWSTTLAEINYLRTGEKRDGLLDVHFVTDEDLVNRTSYAAKIDAVTNAARRLDLGEHDQW